MGPIHGNLPAEVGRISGVGICAEGDRGAFGGEDAAGASCPFGLVAMAKVTLVSSTKGRRTNESHYFK